MADLSTSLRRGTLEFCLLAIVERGDLYSTEIVRTFSAEEHLRVSEGTIYPILSRLRTAGLLESSWIESPSGPPRRYYRLTGAGTAALAGYRRQWTEFSQAVDRLVKAGDDDGN